MQSDGDRASHANRSAASRVRQKCQSEQGYEGVYATIKRASRVHELANG